MRNVKDRLLPSPTDFEILAEKALSRRRFLQTGGAFGAAVFAAGAIGPATADSRLGFEAVAANTLDTVTLPKGYSWHVVASWGDPLWSDAPPFDQATRGTGASQERAMGDNNDGMELFNADGRHILAVNNEYVNIGIIHGNRVSGKPETGDDIRKSKAGHGVTVAEIRERTENGPSSRIRPSTAASRWIRKWRSPGRPAVTI